MAPARRKGSAKAAAAAAAARQQWKVGDLVLAKMKGFPAWPAVISDPKKWGYSSDRKKLLVFFFGTKQIAFCNNADIEAFTEERKKTLLAKRQGKGADFVRAVEEIVDCYEKLQKQILYSGDEETVLDSSILEGSGHKISMGSEDNIPPIRACQSHDCDVQNNGDFNLDKNSISPFMNDDYCNLDSDMKPLVEKVPIIDQLRQTPFANTTSLAKKSRNTLSQNFVIQKKALSLSRSRTFASVDASKFQTAEMRVSKDDSMDIPVESMGNNIEEADLAARNGLPNNAVDNSIRNENEKHTWTVTLVSDDTGEDVGSRVTTVEPKSNLSEDDAFESKDEHYMIASIDANNRVDCQADYQNATFSLKNNRKQNKGEITENMPTYGATDEISQFDIDKNTSSTFNRINERIADADGDEHLPLVKRARARKGDLSLEENQSDVADKESEKLSIEEDGKDSIDLPKKKHTVISAHVVNISPSINCTKSKERDMLLNDQSFHLRGSTVDAEAALPPSKRLHRALEAMSANAAKARDDVIETTEVPEISNDCPDLSEPVTHDTTNSTLRKPEELHKQNTSETVILSLSPRSSSCPVMEAEEQSREMISDAKASSFNRNLQHEETTKISTIDRNPICSVSAEIIKVEDLIQTPKPCLTENSDKTALSTSEKSLSTVEGENEMLQQKKCCFKDAVNQFTSQDGDKMEGENRSFLPDIRKMNAVKHCALFLNDMPPTIPVSGCSMSNVASGSIKPPITLSKEKYEEGDMKQYTAEIKHLHTPKDLLFSPVSTPMKVLIATQAKQHYSRSSSLSDSVTDTKLASDAMSSLSPFHPEDSSEHLSGHSERTNCQLSCSRSPDANSHQKNSTHKSEANGSRLKPLSVHEQKGSNTFSGTAEASAALRSFEALVCTLTRAKESISRATDYAIECAKHDVAGEVVDILVRNLEKESSLHRRVDLFFLVDSITRLCRGQKGIAGDIYPSIFEPVLGRMLSAAAPPGNAAVENRRQCLKVLRLWLERKTLPEPIVHHHIRAIESLNECSLNSGFSRRPSRTERAVDDPVREMEGMLVDEYGSNTCFQLPGLLNSHVFEETGGSDSDDKSFEAVTPEHPHKINGDKESIMNPITEKHKHILEDVDGELEMEDVAPPSAAEINSSRPAVEVGAQHHSQHQFEPHHMLSFVPPLPEDRPPTTPPLPTSPPPLIPPYPSPSAFQLPPTTSKKPADFTTSHSYIGTNSVQNHLAHPNTRHIEQNTKSMPSDVVPYYAPGYRDLSNHMLSSSSSVGSSCAYTSNNASSRLSINQGITNLPLGSESSSNKAYHLQPPPPTVSNQFSYVQSEQQQQQKRQSWVKCSSQSDKLFQLGHDRQVGSLDGKGMVPNESCGFSTTVPSGHIHSEKIEMRSSSLPYYGAHPEASPMTNQCWSHPPRPPSYQYPVPPSRPLENPLPRMNGAPAYWRPR